MNGSFITVVGNLTRDVELRFTPGGDAVADMSIASNRSWKSGDDWEEETTFYKLTVWGQMAENCAELKKGQNVLAIGQLELETWENDEGEERVNLKVRVQDVAISLRWQKVDGDDIEKVTGGGGSRKKSKKSGRGSSGRKSRTSGRSNAKRDYDPSEEPF